MFDLETLKAMNDKKKEEWSERDALPTGDPIGDIDELYKKDQQKYLDMMKKKVINPDNKNFIMRVPQSIDFINIDIEMPMEEEKKCDCGVAKTYKNPTLKMHSNWCKLLEE